MELTDWRGNDILEDSTILYVVRNGSNMYLVEAYVLEVGEEKHGWKEEMIPFIRAKPMMEKGYGKARPREDKEVKLTRVDLITVLE